MGETILIVDDTLVNLKLTRILLSNQGYQVLTAASAEKALEILQTTHPRLILTDIELPGMDGLELTRLVKGGVETRHIPVVALAAFAGPDEQEQAFAAGCDACIPKPVDTQTLGSWVREFLEQRPSAAPPAALAAPPAIAPSSPSAVPAPHNPLLSDNDLQPLRDRFLEEAYGQARQWRTALDAHFDPEPAAQKVHQWIGAAGLLGYPETSEKARALSIALRTRPIDTADVREILDALLRLLAACLANRDPRP